MIRSSNSRRNPQCGTFAAVGKRGIWVRFISPFVHSLAAFGKELLPSRTHPVPVHRRHDSASAISQGPLATATSRPSASARCQLDSPRGFSVRLRSRLFATLVDRQLFVQACNHLSNAGLRESL